MITTVNFEISKLLKEKGFDEYCKLCVEDGDERPLPFNAGNTLHKNSLHPYYSAPTILEVVMWLHKNHGIWIEVRHIKTFGVNRFHTVIWNYKDTSDYTTIYHDDIGPGYKVWDKPEAAYLAAIEYVLTKLI